MVKSKKTLIALSTLIAIFLIISSILFPLGGVGKAKAIATYGNATATDILSGKTATVDAGQITGTLYIQPVIPGGYKLYNDLNTYTGYYETMTKVKSVKSCIYGQVATNFTIKGRSGQIYVNGSPKGILHTNVSSSSYTYYDAVSVNIGDTIELWVIGNSSVWCFDIWAQLDPSTAFIEIP